MIWELLIIALIFIGLTLSIIKSVKRHKLHAEPFGPFFLAALVVFFLATMISLQYASRPPLAYLKPIESHALNKIDDYYLVINTNNEAVFKYDDETIITSNNFYIVDINLTKLKEPTVFKCNFKELPWILSDFLSATRSYDVIVIPSDSVKTVYQEENIPEWVL